MIIRALCFIFLLLISFSSCMEQEEGCLDPYALNFRASATHDCCCEYARVRIQWHKTYMDEIVTDSTKFVDQSGWPFYLKNLDYIFSEIELKNTGNAIFRVMDTILVQTNENNHSNPLIDDPARLSLQGSFSTLGSMRTYGEAEKLIIRSGLSETWNSVIPESLPSSHVLNREPFLFLDEQSGFLMLYLEVIEDPELESGIVFSIINPIEDNFIEIPLQMEIPRNVDFDIPLEIKFDVLFEGVSFLEMSNLEIGQLILANLDSAVGQHIP